MSEKKIQILGETARFDVCGYTRPVESVYHLNSFIYPAVGGKGRIYRLFKVLLSNFCRANCFYCINRQDRDCPRYRFDPDELAGLFFSLWKKGYVDGLFLSSSIDGDASETQERMNKTVEILRKRYNYSGYIHLKVLPGVDEVLIKRAFRLASRLSLNMEAPGTKFLRKLSPDKDFSHLLLKNLKRISIIHNEHPLPAGITSQLIVGAAGESDRDITGFVFHLYNTLNLKRVYYSGFEPVIKTPMENLPSCPPLRELRLYQADILIRQYGFSPSELVFDTRGNLLPDRDPKLVWAENNPQKFPVEINRASMEELVRVPGIGYTGAQKILLRRQERRINSPDELKGIRIRISLASNFLTFNGKHFKGKISAESSDDEKNMIKEEQEPLQVLWKE
ncbi:MAG TPA: helix-hairpin-helix domain-containing protein [bacterium]|nr:helix-hairpin-helix domain-containing protein [bacterium]HPP30546.1 helix-hairpin-helix domain-containing protein [bacterium]